MKKMILTGLLVTLFNFTYAMDTHLDTSIERQNHSSTTMRIVETRDIGSLLVSELHVDSLRTIIQDAVNFGMTMRDRLSPDAMIDVVTEITAREVGARVGIVATQAQAEIVRREDAHRHEVENLETQLVEKGRQLDQAEKINTLRGILLHIPITDKTPIMLRAANLIELDILERHNKVDELYKRFLPYSELFGRTDLDVIATPGDLEILRTYLSNTVVQQPQLLTPFREIGGANWWGEANVDWGEYKRITTLVPEAAQRYVYQNYGRASFGEGWPGHGVKWIDWPARDRFITTGNSKIANINKQRTDSYNAKRTRASAIPFPSESFNRLVDQVNRFFIEGLQDTH